ncbi:unnamed protein product [Rotaria socialis]|uniref:Uncharacterized protein n=3 Tax=Rotaria socialis TaxID=392032 RepID=A0A817WKF3_9BILA|nr:unnamed protein product [Rotaria socialis]CAF3356533.1 unnamed protein product [Rotaria socialis]CAF4677699.1 unnamed protein product [Rotaria socialis]CAF4867050.1 unnamed protein product [Rotaria socialis]
MKPPNFACFFDIDGVITQGPNFIAVAKPAIQALIQLKVPVVFVSNTCMLESDKAKQLSAVLGVTIHPEQVVLAQTPMRTLTDFHNKHVLVSGQGATEYIARMIGFKSITTIEKVCEAFPELDMVDHMNRARLSEMIRTQGLVHDENFRPIDAIVLLGEPIQWERSLQVIIDLLLTDGNPAIVPEASTIEHDHIPIIACNRDLVFKAAADLPRFGHGAFLTCLETLYKSISGNDLKYTAFVGKPYEISFQYAETIANKIALANGQPKIDKVYFIGDNPDVDIVGANMYNNLLQQAMNSKTSITGYSLLPPSDLLSAAVCESILVCTGVYEPGKHKIDGKNPWKLPTTIKLNVLEAIKYVLFKETCPSIVSC